MANRALILVDIQNDFMPGGALPVAGGDEIIPIVNKIEQQFYLVVATQDWHPVNHGSFAVNHPGRQPGDIIELAGLTQVLWPAHCIQNTGGAAFAPGFDSRCIMKIFQKGVDPLIDSYSTFFDNAHRRSTGLADYLKDQKVSEVYIMGLATDYCVKYSVLDACQLGFKVYVITDGCRGINLQPGDVEQAIAEMQAAGAIMISSNTI